MCEAGRILHHLRNNIEDPRNTILIPGFQAEHTLGRKIVERRAEVPIFGEPMRLRAEVVKINALSGHADQHELLRWMKPLVPAPEEGLPGARRAGPVRPLSPRRSTSFSTSTPSLPSGASQSTSPDESPGLQARPPHFFLGERKTSYRVNT